MFQSGDLVVYGSTGVCRVEELTRPAARGADRGKLFYLLKPLHQDGVIYTPAEGGKVPIRPVIPAEEARALLEQIPTLTPEICRGPTLQALSQHYQAAIRTHDCRELLRLMVSIRAKRHQLAAQNRRPGMVDERFLKQAEQLLCSEFAVALQVSPEEVQADVERRLEARRPES